MYLAYIWLLIWELELLRLEISVLDEFVAP